MKPTLIRSLLVLVLLCVQLATVVIVVLGMRQQTNEQFIENARATLERLAETVAERTHEFLRPAESALRVADRMLQGGVVDPRDDRALIALFHAELGAHDPVTRMYLTRDDGSAVEVVRTDVGFQATRRLERQGRMVTVIAELDVQGQVVREWQTAQASPDPRQQRAYERAVQAGDQVWLDAHVRGAVGGAGGAGVTAVRPVQAEGGRESGVIGLDVDLSSLHAFIADIPMAASASAAIVDAVGHTVAFSHPERLQAMASGNRLPRVEAVVGSPLRALLEAGGPMPSAEPVAGFRRFTVGETEHYGLRQPFATTRAGLNWWLVAQVPADEFSGGLRSLFQQKLRTLIAAVLIPAIIAVLAVFGLTEPVYRLHQDATVDGLTGCLNREEFRRRLEGMLRNRREMEYVDRVVVVTFDLDGFKAVNDRLGHEAGDVVLQAFASRLRERVRQDDLLGRLGGDEFALAMRVDRGVDVSAMVNGIRRGVVGRPFDTGHGRRLLGVTAGVACIETGETCEHALARADQALITGKARRKNRVYMAPETSERWPRTVIAKTPRRGEAPPREPAADRPAADGPAAAKGGEPFIQI
jgi:diguanylate cyclase (GGDEF)-like protein